MPPLARLPGVGIHGPIVPPVVRPFAIASVTSNDNPQTTVYIGKISSTVENDFMLSLLQLCGPLKNWRRPQDPTGTLKGFGFCEFESAEGVLRALRLLSKLSIDGQKLMVNVNQTTREYLELYVEKKWKVQRTSKDQKLECQYESPKPSLDEQKDGSESSNKVEEQTTTTSTTTSKTPVDGLENSEQPSGSRDWESDGDVTKNDFENKNEDDKTAESKPSNDNDRTEPGSPDRSRRLDRSRDRDRDQRTKRERERNYKSVEDIPYVKKSGKLGKEKKIIGRRESEEKERKKVLRKGSGDQERDSDDGYRKKRKFKSSGEDRKRRLREKEEDLADRLREEEQIAEKLHDASNIVISGQPSNEHDKAALLRDTNSEYMVNSGKGVVHNGIGDESTRKLGFGLSESGKGAAVPSMKRPLVPIDYSEEQQIVQPSISERPPATVVAAAEDVNHISTLNTKEEKHDVGKERGRHSHEEETSSTIFSNYSLKTQANNNFLKLLKLINRRVKRKYEGGKEEISMCSIKSQTFVLNLYVFCIF
ncbi:hypothetical protein ACJIZ3_010301 [Penstemon smallii]|uniref:RRM domain-containing protein n=1 Tax=Penstemon smallii TaxID=265156 RepID=A0ABD3TEZ3_9LAMI